MASREQIKREQPVTFKLLASKSKARVDALLHAVTIAQLSTSLDRTAMRNVLTAELETYLYHQARADGDEHQAAMERSRQGRKQVDVLAGWA